MCWTLTAFFLQHLGCIKELYHYTNRTGYEKISEEHKIKGSTDRSRDVAFGEGIYLTSLNPKDNDKPWIAENNWDGGWKQKYRDGFTDYFFKILIPSNDGRLSDKSGIDRNIYLYKADWLYLDFYVWKPGENLTQ